MVTVTLEIVRQKFPKPIPPIEPMKIIVNTDNEAEIWRGNKKVGYVDNGALYAIVEYNAHSEAQYVGDPDSRTDILPMLRKYFEQEGRAV